jgi:hypothetical protein
MSNVAIAAPDPTKARDFSRFSCRRFDTVGTVRLAVPGELDMATVPELEGTLRHARADAWRVVLDLRELEFIDSSGVHLGAVSAVGARTLRPASARRADTLFSGEQHAMSSRTTSRSVRQAVSGGLAGSDCAFPRVTRRPPLFLLGGGSPSSTARTVTKTIFNESSVMSTLAAASIGTSLQRALNGPLPQRARRRTGRGLRSCPRRLTDRTANES